jgi:hypothetical protein
MAWTKGKTAAVAVALVVILSGAITILVNAGYFQSRENRIYNGGVNHFHALPNRLYTYPDGDETTREYILALFKRFHREADPARDLKSDRELTEQDIRTRPIYIYGSPENHSLFRRIRAQLPIVFESDGIVVGKKKCMGRDVGAIFACPNPLNPEQRIAVYGAVSPDAVKNMNGVFHGPTDYVVFNNATRRLTEAQPNQRFLLEGAFDKSDRAHWRIDEELQLLPPKELRQATAGAIVPRG